MLSAWVDEREYSYQIVKFKASKWSDKSDQSCIENIEFIGQQQNTKAKYQNFITPTTKQRGLSFSVQK